MHERQPIPGGMRPSFIRIGHLVGEAATLSNLNLYRGHMQPTHADAILTRHEVAGWLKVRPRQVERLRIPCIDLGRKSTVLLTAFAT